MPSRDNLVILNDDHTDADIEDCSDDMDTNEDPFGEGKSIINTQNPMHYIE